MAVYGIDGTIAFGGIAAAENIVKGASLTDSFRIARLTKNGHIIGSSADERVRSVQFRITPYDPLTAPSSLTVAKTNAVLPADEFDAVTAASFGLTDYDGEWSFVGGSIEPREDGHLEIVITCEKYKQSDGSFKALHELGTA